MNNNRIPRHPMRGLQPNRQIVHLNENQIVDLVVETARRMLSESILDNFDPVIIPETDGKFWFKDVGSSLTFKAKAWVAGGEVYIDLEPDKYDTRAELLFKNERFKDLCIRAILKCLPDNIKGFSDFAEEYGDYYDALDYLEKHIGVYN